MVTDPIADALTRIRNANMVKHESVNIPASKLKIELVKLLKEEGYIADYKIVEKGKFSDIAVTLKYKGATPVISGLQRVSSSGLRIYTKAKHVPRVYDGMGIAVISTSKGLMTDRKAKEVKLGGEILCYVW